MNLDREIYNKLYTLLLYIKNVLKKYETNNRVF